MDWLSYFWSHTLVQIGAWVASIVLSTFLGYYVTLVGEKTRELTYHVNPTRAVIVKAGGASLLQVYHGSRPVTTDVSAVQVQIWNQGREAIRRAHMLQDLVLSTADQTSILEATVRKQTRPDIVHLQLDDSAQQSGRVKVSWDILEQWDGGIVQLVIAGKPDAKVKAEAVIEGQQHIHEVALIRSARGRAWSITTVIFVAGLVGFAVMGISSIRGAKQEPVRYYWQETARYYWAIFWGIGFLLLLSITLYQFFRSFSPTAPLAF